MQHLKKFSDYQQFKFELILKVLFFKIFEKIEVYDFCLKKCVIFVELGPFSRQSFKIFSK